MSTHVDEITGWPDALSAAAAATGGVLSRVFVVRETRSTQEAARTLATRPGDVVVAGRQSAGRGRLGRPWADTGADGVAMTIVLAPTASERLSIVAAVAVAEALSAVRGAAVAIKWPNDVLAEGRKLAGILVEQTAGVALVGVGVNVGQTVWPAALADRAVSLRQLGLTVDRLTVMRATIAAIAATVRSGDETLVRRFAAHDTLAGGHGRFRSAGREYAGRVVGVDPMRGLELRVGEDTVWLPAAQTTVLSTGP